MRYNPVSGRGRTRSYAEWIAKDNSTGRSGSLQTFGTKSAFLRLTNLPGWGVKVLIEGTRELIEYPYIIVYRVDEQRREIVVISIIHGVRDREGKETE
jgi:toxin ParE1/3/4